MVSLNSIFVYLNLKRLIYFKFRLIFVILTVSSLTLLYVRVLTISDEINSQIEESSLLKGNVLLNISINMLASDKLIDRSENSLGEIMATLLSSKYIIESYHLLNAALILPVDRIEDKIPIKVIIRGNGSSCFDGSCREFECVENTRNYTEKKLLLPSGYICDRLDLPEEYRFLNTMSKDAFLMADKKNADLILKDNWQSTIEKTIITVSSKVDILYIKYSLESLLRSIHNIDFSVDLSVFNSVNKKSGTFLVSSQNKIIFVLSIIALPVSLLFLMLGQKKLIRLECGLRLSFGAVKKELYMGVTANAFIQSCVISTLGIFVGYIIAIVFNVAFSLNVNLDLSNLLIFLLGLILINGLFAMVITYLIINRNVISLLRSK